VTPHKQTACYDEEEWIAGELLRFTAEKFVLSFEAFELVCTNRREDKL
jgi:hypothetical protein